MTRDEFKKESMLRSPICALQVKAGVIEGQIFWRSERIFAEPGDGYAWIKPQLYNYGTENMDWRLYGLPCNGQLAVLLDAPDTASPVQRVLREVHAERLRQDEKWGADRKLSPHVFHTVLSEEVGECAEAILERQLGNLRTELVQVAAVAVASVESLDLPEPQPEIVKSEVAS